MHSSIEQCAVGGKPKPDVGESPMALVHFRSKGETTPQDVMDPVNFQVAPYKQIGEVVFVDETHVSPTRKALKKDPRKRL